MLIRLTAEELITRWATNEKEQNTIEQRVIDILTRVKVGGDAAVAQLSQEIEGFIPESVYIPWADLRAYSENIAPEMTAALKAAAHRIEKYHLQQKAGESSALIPEQNGGITGWVNRPLQRVACYVPGGRSPYPSSVLMTVIPAKVAGVKDIVVVTPPRQQGGDDAIMAAAYLTGAAGVYRLGGAIAVAAMAYGTETIKPADKVVGPGNRYVEAAKRLAASEIATDLPAGPSELVLITDGKTDPCWLAADLLAQAEHSPDAASVLITTDADILEAVNNCLHKLIPSLTHSAEALTSLSSRGGAVVVSSMDAALELANRCAPEHLQICVQEPWPWLGKIENAGAVFLGPLTPVALGDYWAGPSHVLPTGGAARFASPLGVDDFSKRISIVYASQTYLKQASTNVQTIARQEGFDAHALSVELRDMQSSDANCGIVRGINNDENR